MAQQQSRTAWDIETVLVHSGRSSHIASPSGTPTAPPIYTSTTYLHENMEVLDSAFDGTTSAGQRAYAGTDITPYQRRLHAGTAVYRHHQPGCQYHSASNAEY